LLLWSQAAAQCYIDLIIKESDNNVKLIVLDRLIELKEHPTHERVLQVNWGGCDWRVVLLSLIQLFRQCIANGRPKVVNTKILL